MLANSISSHKSMGRRATDLLIISVMILGGTLGSFSSAQASPNQQETSSPNENGTVFLPMITIEETVEHFTQAEIETLMQAMEIVVDEKEIVDREPSADEISALGYCWRQTTRYGNQGSSVQHAQKQLLKVGGMPAWYVRNNGGADGHFGAGTWYAVREYQKMVFPGQSWEWDGTIGQKTWGMLGCNSWDQPKRTSGVPSPQPQPATCNVNIPSQQQLNNALNQMSQERHAQFTFPKYPELGVFVHEIFIKQSEFEITGNTRQEVLNNLSWITAPLGARLTVKGQGDNRGHSSNFQPSQSRGFVVLDFREGKGYVVDNNSTIKVQAQFPFYTQTLGHHSFSARNIHFEWAAPAWGWWNKNWIYADWVNPDTFRVRYSLRASGPGGSFIMDTIDQQLLINRADGRITSQGDGFPSLATYQYRCNGSMVQQQIQHQDTLSRLGDPQNFSYNAPYNQRPR